MIRAVIFDMDGLLIDSEPFWAQAELEILPKYGINLTPEDCKRTQGISIGQVVRYWYEQKPWTGATVDEVAQQISQRVVELIIEKGELMPCVHQTLQFFKDRNIPMAVASSSAPELIELVLRNFDLMKYFEFYHSAKFEKQGKPAPDVFLSTARKFNRTPAECLVFEDSLNGVIAARRAGMKVVAVPYPEDYNNPKFDELAHLKLKSLCQWNEQLFDKINQIP